MKNPNKILLAIFAFCLSNHFAYAEEERSVLVPLPSIDDFTDGNGWGFGLGLGIEYESAYEGSDEFGTELDPAGGIQWRKDDSIYYWAGQAFGWRGLVSDSWLIDTSLGFNEGREESDSDDGRLDGLGDVEEGSEFLLQVRRDFGQDWRNWLDARLLLGENGNLAVLAAGHRFGNQNNGTGLEVSVFAAFNDDELANTDFGVTSTQSRNSGLPETSLDGGFRSVGLSLNYRYNVTRHWQIFGEALYESFGSEISDSPISREDYEAEIGIGVIYIF